MNGYANLSEPDAQGRVGVRVRVKVRLMLMGQREG